MIKAREAREKQEKERAERAAKKRALVDFNAPDDQEGVMDSLLEALKTGSAFNREQKRKRPPRAAGGTTHLYFDVSILFAHYIFPSYSRFISISWIYFIFFSGKKSPIES